MIRALVILSIIVSGFDVIAQDNGSQTGKIEIICDARLNTLMDRYVEKKKKEAVTQGFRIQLVASSSRSGVYKVKSQFYSLFPDKRPFVVYQQPNFKLRVGSYLNRLEAYGNLQKIAKRFPDAFIIRDDIPIAELQVWNQ